MKLKSSGLSLLVVSATSCFFSLLLSVGSLTQAQAAELYVDGSLQMSCSTYSVQLRNCSGSNSTAYKTIQEAVSRVIPGDTVYVRGGIYTLPARQEIVLTALCTQSAPCTVSGYQSEVVTIRGPMQYPGADADKGDGTATGPADTTDRAKLVRVTGQYWTVTKFIIENGGWYGCEVSGSNNTLVELIIRHNWATGCQVFAGGNNNTFKYLAVHHTRHGSGIEVTVPTDATVGAIGNRFERNLSFENGRDGSSNQVLRYTGPGGEGGDPGGANSDGMGSDKGCADAGAMPRATNLCTGTVFKENSAWLNIDDCFDMAVGNSWVIGNFASNCGPEGNRGFKVFYQTAGLIFSGNICYHSQDTCFDPQAIDPIRYINNAAIDTPGYGFRISALNTLSTSVASNNLTFSTAGTANWASIATVQTNKTSGDPGLVNSSVSMDYAVAESDADFPMTTVQSRWQHLWNQIEGNFKPSSASSAVVNAGTVVSGYHCPLADDRGQDVNAPCRHWMGSAPDVGPFEFGIVGNPDRLFLTTDATPPPGPLPPAPSSLTIR